MMRLLLYSILLWELAVSKKISVDDQEYISVEEFRSRRTSGYSEFQNENFTEVGILTVDRVTNVIYVGARNQIHRISVDFNETHRRKLKSSKDLMEVFEIHPFPLRSHVHNVDSGTETSNQTLTFDTCLSYNERIWSSISQSQRDLHALPSNARPRNAWIRFGKEFESYVCKNTFIRNIRIIKDINGKSLLWVCGTFATFPKAFLMDPDTLEVINRSSFSDTSLPSCARWPDEPMASKMDEFGSLFVASGWGLYRPGSKLRDDSSDSTMLYSDWKMLWNGLHWPTRMAMTLSNDVRFIPRVYETKHYLYFFGHEVNDQLSYVNSLTRQSYHSFMLRICKNDTGFRYSFDAKTIKQDRQIFLKKFEEFWVTKKDGPFNVDETAFSYSKKGWNETYRFPTKHFTSSIKLPFGCYLKRFDGAQSLNNFWGQQNIVYFNRLADTALSFNWTDELTRTRGKLDHNIYTKEFSGFEFNRNHYNPNAHIYNSMIGAFSSNSAGGKEDFAGSAVCQFQVSEWKLDYQLRDREPSPPPTVFKLNDQLHDFGGSDPFANAHAKNQRQYNVSTDAAKQRFPDSSPVNGLTARQEFMALYSTFKDSMFSKGNTWSQGLNPIHREGIDFMSVPKFKREQFPFLSVSLKCGNCLSQNDLEKMTNEMFEERMNYSTTAWPTDWFSHLTKYYDAFFHLNPMSVAGDNASFVMANVEFSKMIVLLQNYTSYLGHGVEAAESPLTYVLLITTEGDVFRVVMCDLVSIPIKDTKCEMRNTDQPYVTPRTMTMRYNDRSKNEFEKLRQVRVSSLLSTWRMTEDGDRGSWEKINPQSPLLKDTYFDDSSQTLFLLVRSRLMRLRLTPKDICGSYRTCVGCASDPHCYWEATLTLETGNCNPVMMEDGEIRVPSSTPNRFFQDVLGRGEKCKMLIPTIEDWTLKVVCEQQAAVHLECKHRSLFRGFFKWKVGKQENMMRDIDDEDDEDSTIYAKHEEDLIIKSVEGSSLYQCVGIGFDDHSETVIMQYNVTVIDRCDEMQMCLCPLWRKILPHPEQHPMYSRCTQDNINDIDCDRANPL